MIAAESWNIVRTDWLCPECRPAASVMVLNVVTDRFVCTWCGHSEPVKLEAEGAVGSPPGNPGVDSACHGGETARENQGETCSTSPGNQHHRYAKLSAGGHVSRGSGGETLISQFERASGVVLMPWQQRILDQLDRVRG